MAQTQKEFFPIIDFTDFYGNTYRVVRIDEEKTFEGPRRLTYHLYGGEEVSFVIKLPADWRDL